MVRSCVTYSLHLFLTSLSTSSTPEYPSVILVITCIWVLSYLFRAWEVLSTDHSFLLAHSGKAPQWFKICFFSYLSPVLLNPKLISLSLFIQRQSHELHECWHFMLICLWFMHTVGYISLYLLVICKILGDIPNTLSFHFVFYTMLIMAALPPLLLRLHWRLNEFICVQHCK